MKIKLKKGYNQYGAFRGRSNESISGKCHLQHVHLNSGGYDAGGAYWGNSLSRRIYVLQDESGNQAFVGVAWKDFPDETEYRDKAKCQALKEFPGITFFR